MSILDLTQFFIFFICYRPAGPSFVFAATHQKASRVVEVKTPDSWCVPSCHCVGTYPLVHRVLVCPTFNCIVVACRIKLVSVWMPLYLFDILQMAAKNCKTRKIHFLFLISFINPYWFVSAACCDVFGVVAPSNRLDFIFMTFKSLYGLEITILKLLPNYTCSIKAWASEYHLSSWHCGLPC